MQKVMNWGAKAKLLNLNYYYPDYQQITKCVPNTVFVI